MSITELRTLMASVFLTPAAWSKDGLQQFMHLSLHAHGMPHGPSPLYARHRCLRVQVWTATPLCTKLSWAESGTVHATINVVAAFRPTAFDERSHRLCRS